MNTFSFGGYTLALPPSFRYTTVCGWIWDMFQYGEVKIYGGTITDSNDKLICRVEINQTVVPDCRQYSKLAVKFVYPDGHIKWYGVSSKEIRQF